MPESDDAEADDAEFYISSFSGGGGCVAVVRLGNEYVVRHSRRHASRIVFTREEWVAFVSGVKNDEFDF